MHNACGTLRHDPQGVRCEIRFRVILFRHRRAKNQDNHTMSKPFRSTGGSSGPTVADKSFLLASHTEGPVLAKFDSLLLDTDPSAGTTTSSNSGALQHGFSPYDFNGGTVAAVAGKDYCVVAADTRLSSGYEILSRNSSKLHALTDTAILASSGCKTDVDQLRSWLDIKQKVNTCSA